MRGERVFGIGFHKTGTTSLQAALEKLGYRVVGNVVEDFIKGLCPLQGNPSVHMKKILRKMDKYDACQDMPWPLLYSQLDKRYPGSKFILTLRDTDTWIKSVINHFKRPTKMREYVYGKGCSLPRGNEMTYIKRYESHNEEVKRYFEKRHHDLLILPLEENNKVMWKNLCSFLGKEKSPLKYPQKRVGKY